MKQEFILYFKFPKQKLVKLKKASFIKDVINQEEGLCQKTILLSSKSVPQKYLPTKVLTKSIYKSVHCTWSMDGPKPKKKFCTLFKNFCKQSCVANPFR